MCVAIYYMMQGAYIFDAIECVYAMDSYSLGNTCKHFEVKQKSMVVDIWQMTCLVKDCSLIIEWRMGHPIRYLGHLR